MSPEALNIQSNHGNLPIGVHNMLLPSSFFKTPFVYLPKTIREHWKYLESMNAYHSTIWPGTTTLLKIKEESWSQSYLHISTQENFSICHLMMEKTVDILMNKDQQYEWRYSWQQSVDPMKPKQDIWRNNPMICSFHCILRSRNFAKITTLSAVLVAF